MNQKSLKIILPIGIVLCAVVGITTYNIRSEAEVKLNKEKTINAVRNQAISAEQQARTNLENQRRQAEIDRQYNR